MVYFTVDYTAKAGKMEEARQLLLEIAAYGMENYSGVEVQVLTNINGPSNRLHWVTLHESLSTLDAAIDRWAKDSKAQEYMAKLPAVLESHSETNLFRVES